MADTLTSDLSKVDPGEAWAAFQPSDAVPWDLLEFGLPVLMAVSLVALFPFSRLVWLAFDLMLRPVTPQELEWHRETPDEWSSVRDAGRD